MQRLIIVIVLISISCSLFSQGRIRVKRSSDNLPITGAHVIFSDEQKRVNQTVITDSEGIAYCKLALPVTYKVTHLSYQPVFGTLTEETKDISLKSSPISLDNIVITGQFEPQSINQSVHTVKAIDRKRIEAQGAVDLADALSNNLNITLTPNKSSGRTSISMLGLDGQYVKILVDGIPFASIDGNGNNVDITQINLNNIERIEIVEGSMAVNYGANAFAGVINLITRSIVTNSISIQEETVGSEYGIDQGRHIQSLNLGYKFKNDISIQGFLQRNDFRGFLNGFEGSSHLLNDGQRGYDWHPKLQHNANISASHMAGEVKIKYRFSYFNQTLNMYSRTVFADEHPSSGIKSPFALDDRNSTKRLAHNLSLSGSLGRINYNIASGYAKVEAKIETIRKRIQTGVQEEVTDESISFLKSFTSRGNFTNILESDAIEFEIGYEYTFESSDGADIIEGNQSIDNLAAFTSLEWSPIPEVTFRPGLRTMYNSLYSTPLIYSFNAKFIGPANTELRASFGRSYRTPNITELYFFFVDANHNVTGNPDLNPEDGHGASLDIKKNLKIRSLLGSISLKVFYNDLQDQITLGVVNQNPLQFRYLNVERFKSKGASFSNRFEWEKFTLNTGMSYIGRFNQFSQDNEGLDSFLFSTEINVNSIYSLRDPDISFALFYKYTGPVEQYILDGNTGDFRKGKTNAFNWVDFTTTWKTNPNFEIQGGIKNILNLQDVQTSSSEAGAHSNAPTSVGLTYGRSYFLRATYNF